MFPPITGLETRIHTPLFFIGDSARGTYPPQNDLRFGLEGPLLKIRLRGHDQKRFTRPAERRTNLVQPSAILEQTYRDAVRYLGSKSIHHCDRLPTIARAFPNARFVVLWRPMDEIMDSLQRAGRTNAYLAPMRRRRQLFQQYSQLAEGVLMLRRLECPVHEVSYPEMVANPEAACRELCGFLGLPWSQKMLSIDPDNISAIPIEAHHFHARCTPIGAVLAQHPQLRVEVAARIHSYEQYWAKRFAGQPLRLAPRSALLPRPAMRFFALVRWKDSLFYQAHRRLIFAKLVIYRFAPLSCLRWYRRHRAHIRPSENGVYEAPFATHRNAAEKRLDSQRRSGAELMKIDSALPCGIADLSSSLWTADFTVEIHGAAAR